jgi:flagellar biosynthesis GTPase FlhF
MARAENFHRRHRSRPGSARFVFALGWLLLLVLVGAGSYLGVSLLVNRETDRGTPAPSLPPPARTSTEPVPEKRPDTPTKADDPDARTKAEEAARREKERQEADRKKQQEEAQAREKAAQELEQQAREEEKRKQKEEQARIEAEKLLALKRNPPRAVSLETIDRAPDRFYGEFVRIDRVSIKLEAIEHHKDLGRFTIGVTSELGQYYSRVPLGGLVVSTSDRLGKQMQLHLQRSDEFYRCKLFAEVRRWQKKGGTQSWPEVYVYRLEAYDRMGQLTKALEE